MNELQRSDFQSENLPAISSGTMIEQSRAVAEAQAAMAVAQARPRDEYRAYAQIMKACDRVSLASSSMYAYKRGGAMVEGPSIRLAEVLARAWGNITYGLREVSRVEGESEIEAFAWDLESNTRVTRQFVLRHIRDKKGGGEKLKDERDIYELAANMGQRRVRACLLELIPGDIVEEAVNRCKKTLAKGDKPLADRIRDMVVAFDALGVSREMLEKYLQHKIDAAVPAQLVKLLQIYTSINTGIATRDEFFPVNDLNERFAKAPPPADHNVGNPVTPNLFTKPVPETVPETLQEPETIDNAAYEAEAKKINALKSSEAVDKWRFSNFERIANAYNGPTAAALSDHLAEVYSILKGEAEEGQG